MRKDKTYVMHLSDLAGKGSISNEDWRSNADCLGKTLVGTSDLGVVSLDGVVSHDLQGLSSLDVDWLVVSKESSSDLWSLGVEHDSAVLVWSLLEGLSQVVDRLGMSLVVSVREVQSSNVHTSIEHLDEHLNIPAGWSKQIGRLG